MRVSQQRPQPPPTRRNPTETANEQRNKRLSRRERYLDLCRVVVVVVVDVKNKNRYTKKRGYTRKTDGWMDRMPDGYIHDNLNPGE